MQAIMYAIIDVETTGGSAAYERITEIAIVLHDGEKIIDQFNTLLNPERSIPWNITQLTGITDQMVATAPKFFEVAKRIVEITEGAIFVAHNVTFDYKFVQEEFARLGFPYVRRQLCTVRMSRKAFPGLPSYSLSNLKKHFSIVTERSHRALDDTMATVDVFERILATQNGENIREFIHHGVKESKLPKSITLDILHALPEDCGIYYLHNNKGEVIYVGKSLNIRKRLFEHFADMTPKGEKLRAGVEDISFEIMGSELLALLRESEEIKRLQPPINRAQRIRNFAGCVFSYTDQNGYVCLAFGKNTAKNAKQLNVVSEFPKVDSAKMHLQSLARKYELCHRLCHLDASDRACFHYGIKKCMGACIGEESASSYNERVAEALVQMNKRLSGSFLILDKGKDAESSVLIAILDGNYGGYCHVDNHFTGVAEDVFDMLEKPKEKDPDAARIIHSFMEHKPGLKVIKL